MTTIDAETCIRSMTIMGSGDLDDLNRVVHPQATNREAKDEPPACRGQGPGLGPAHPGLPGADGAGQAAGPPRADPHLKRGVNRFRPRRR
ncbi:hypothetical protein [Actinoplanes sp. DH11]|uniref:hypothetical protein n=1 Tax=Actinoplanes sp. DH11 TaxID=2857011 RepID=UPI001E639369|nr:hypothetical protein [Actinoplanes sp. DH11]